MIIVLDGYLYFFIFSFISMNPIKLYLYLTREFSIDSIGVVLAKKPYSNCSRLNNLPFPAACSRQNEPINCLFHRFQLYPSGWVVFCKMKIINTPVFQGALSN